MRGVAGGIRGDMVHSQYIKAMAAAFIVFFSAGAAWAVPGGSTGMIQDEPTWLGMWMFYGPVLSFLYKFVTLAALVVVSVMIYKAKKAQAPVTPKLKAGLIAAACLFIAPFILEAVDEAFLVTDAKMIELSNREGCLYGEGKYAQAVEVL